jgi:hypothetical protein
MFKQEKFKILEWNQYFPLYISYMRKVTNSISATFQSILMFNYFGKVLPDVRNFLNGDQQFFLYQLEHFKIVSRYFKNFHHLEKVIFWIFLNFGSVERVRSSQKVFHNEVGCKLTELLRK